KQIERVGGQHTIQVDVRVLAATHVDLEAAIADGRFREDLYYRLNVLEIRTTPLRERVADILPMARHFARLYMAEIGRRPRNFSAAAIQAMQRHDWPGNGRELANRVRRGMVLADGREIEAADLGLAPTPSQPQGQLASLEQWVLRAERQALQTAPAHSPGTIGQVAEPLRISRPTRARLLRKHQIRWSMARRQPDSRSEIVGKLQTEAEVRRIRGQSDRQVGHYGQPIAGSHGHADIEIG